MNKPERATRLVNRFEFERAVRGCGFNAPTRHVLLALATYGGAKPVLVRPSINKLIKDTALSRSSVIRALELTEAAGYLRRERKRGRHNDYHLTLPAGEKHAPVEAVAETGVTATLVSQGNPTSVPQTLGPVSQGHPINTFIKPTISRAARRQGFDDFWQAYPKKRAKKDALSAWEKLNLTSEQTTLIMKALEAQKHSEDWLRESGRFIPYAATWLNGRRFDDELPIARVVPESIAIQVYADRGDDSEAWSIRDYDYKVNAGAKPAAVDVARRAFGEYRSAPWMKHARNVVVRIGAVQSRFSIAELQEPDD